MGSYGRYRVYSVDTTPTFTRSNHCHNHVLLIRLLFAFCTAFRQSTNWIIPLTFFLQCTPTCPATVEVGTWNSDIYIQNILSTSIDVQWNDDDPKGATSFVVGVRLQHNGDIFKFSGVVSKLYKGVIKFYCSCKSQTG